MEEQTETYDPSFNQTVVDNPPTPPTVEDLIAMIVKKKERENMFYKYDEHMIIADFHDYIDKTYGEHYKTDERSIECFDAWIALGDSTATFRNTAIKYLWRYGKKNGNNKDDLMKALHYTLMCLYVDHYKDGN
jgi:hypothetical protein